MEVCLINRPAEKKRLLEALQSFAQEHQLPDKVVQAVDLALEEWVTNVMNYAYADSNRHDILVRLEIVGDSLQVQIVDDGRSFNPLEHPSPDVTLPLDQRPVGGLGIHLVRKFMDDLSYRREAGKNIFQMRKSLR